MRQFVQGAIEYVIVETEDRLENVTDLSAYDLDFKVLAHPSGTEEIAYTSATADALLILCLLDTSSLDLGKFDLIARAIIPPETILFGPYTFEVI